MSKASDLGNARLQGMAYALNRIKEIGLDEFEKELAWRARCVITTAISPQELYHNNSEIIKQHDEIARTLIILILHDEFDFGKKRLKRFLDRWQLKAGCVIEKYVSWPEMKALADEILGEKRI